MSRHHKGHLQPPRRRDPHQIIIAKGDEVRSFVLRGWMIALGVVFAVGITFWLFAATAYVVFRDDVLAGMMARQTKMQHAYEDRIAALRLQIDRVTSRQLLDQEAFNARLDELMRRQAQLDSRAQAINGAVERARQSGLMPPTSGVDPITTGSIATPTDRAERVEAMLNRVDTALSQLQHASELTLDRIETRTHETEARLRSVLGDLGLDADKLAGPRPPPRLVPGVGGPLVPLHPGVAVDPIELRAVRLEDSVAFVERLRRGLNAVPLRRPVDGEIDVRSTFGPRIDPFLGVPAFHAGIDFGAETGDPVHATAAGTVVSAGRSGGYGNMVEIDHGNGLSTRYGHMSQILVHEGQTVTAGQIIGRAGSTGRATGPHVHYETRVNDDAVNPERFIKASQRLGMW